MGQASGVQESMNQASTKVLDTDITLDICAIQLPDGALCTETDEASAYLLQIKNLGLNTATLPIQTLHELHQGVYNELRIRKKLTLLVISEVKTNNQQIFEEKAQALKEKEEIIARS